MLAPTLCLSFFFFNDTATTEIYTLSLHDALPICHSIQELMKGRWHAKAWRGKSTEIGRLYGGNGSQLHNRFWDRWHRSEEHTSELQSHSDLVCRLLLEKKKQ